jgi:ABC-2 type transport system permease protein
MLNITLLDSEAEAKDRINQGKLAAVVILNRGFSDAIMAGESASIEVLADPEQPIRSGVVKSIVESYTLEVLKRRTMVETFLGTVAPYSSVNPMDLQKMIPEWLKEIENEKDIVLVKSSTEKKSTNEIPAMGYYAVGMAVMYLLFATNAGTETIFEERRLKTYDRIRTAPVPENVLFGGKLLGIFLVAFVQFLIIVLFTALFYGVSWGKSLSGIFILMVSSVLAFSGFSTLLASIAKSEEQIGNIGPALAMIFSFLGGGMWPAFLFPQWMNVVSRFTPNRWALDGFLKLMESNANFAQVLPQCGVLVMMALLFFLIGTLRLKARGV